MLNILIVEDDFEDMQYCAALIEQLDVEANLLQAGNGKKAVDILLQHDVDVAFIDVRLPDMSGFDLAQKIRDIDKYELLHIVFVTAVADKQLQAYKAYHCYDYITKPIEPEAFRATMSCLLENIAKRHKKEDKRSVIFVDTGDTKRALEVDRILFIESVNRRIDIYTENEKIRKVKMTLKEAIDCINSPYFVRCHKSFAVNLRKVEVVKQVEKRTWRAYFANDKDDFCYIGRAYRKMIEERLKEFNTRVSK